MPGHGVHGAHRLAQPPGHGLEQPVTDLVAGGVVHGLEMVEVEENDPDPVPLTPAAFQGVAHAVFEQPPVRQAREVVVHRLVGERPFRRLLLGDVPDDLGHTAHPAPPVPHRGQGNGNLHPAAMLALSYRLDSGQNLAGPGPAHQLGRFGFTVGGDDHADRGAQDLLFVPAEQLAGGMVPDLDGPAVPAAHDGLVTVLGDRGQQRLAVDGAVALGTARAITT